MRHGGDLSQAAEAFGGSGEDWLDLSTGINPVPYPFRRPSAESWQKLPQSDALAGLIEAARTAYGAPISAAVAAAPGTQMLIQLLPVAFPAQKVAVVGPTYSEHALCWRAAGAEVVAIDDLAGATGMVFGAGGDILSSRKPEGLSGIHRPQAGALPGADMSGSRLFGRDDNKNDFGNAAEMCSVVVAVNPNNPDGRSWTPEHVLACADEMAQRGGLLIVDEAFADVKHEVSVTPHAGREGLVVMRSFGKFFGLAGVRLGFALGPQALIARLAELLGPWAISGPAIEIGAQALRDTEWQNRARMRCAETAARLDALLADAGFEIVGGTPLFRLAQHEQAQDIHRDLARQGIWVRRFDEHRHWLRFGLPGGEGEFKRLAAALS